MGLKLVCCLGSLFRCNDNTPVCSFPSLSVLIHYRLVSHIKTVPAFYSFESLTCISQNCSLYMPLSIFAPQYLSHIRILISPDTRNLHLSPTFLRPSYLPNLKDDPPHNYNPPYNFPCLNPSRKHRTYPRKLTANLKDRHYHVQFLRRINRIS